MYNVCITKQTVLYPIIYTYTQFIFIDSYIHQYYSHKTWKYNPKSKKAPYSSTTISKCQPKKSTQSPTTTFPHQVKLHSILNSDSASRNNSAKKKIQNRQSSADSSNFMNTTRKSNLVVNTLLLEKNPTARAISQTTNLSYLVAISKN